MARTQSLQTPDELRPLRDRSLEQRDRYILGVVQGHKREPSKRQKRLLKRAAVVNSPQQGRGSLFRFLSPFWWELSTSERVQWNAAAVFSALSGWQLFISDNAARIRESLTFPLTPSDEWQVRAGYITINAPASSIHLKQEHPSEYWVASKVVGKPWKRELVRLRETFSLPLEISLSYKSALVPVGGAQAARFFARVWTSYQGEDIQNDLVIDLLPSTDWVHSTRTFASLRGIIISYTLHLQIEGYTGEVLLDNIRAVHSGTNWARDPRCDKIQETFTKAFAVVPPYWEAVDVSDGANFFSEFPPLLS
jgi:hypothetical protein